MPIPEASVPHHGHGFIAVGRREGECEAQPLTRTVVSSVLQARQTIAQYFAHELAVLFRQEGAVSEDTCEIQSNNT